MLEKSLRSLKSTVARFLDLCYMCFRFCAHSSVG